MRISKKQSALLALVALDTLLWSQGVFAAEAGTFSQMASNITGQFEGLAKLVTGGSYIAGIGFSLGAVMKFKAHKDNPTQVPVGTPVSLTFIAGALLFFPTVLGMTGQSIFGTTSTAGSTGKAWSGTGA